MTKSRTRNLPIPRRVRYTGPVPELSGTNGYATLVEPASKNFDGAWDYRSDNGRSAPMSTLRLGVSWTYEEGQNMTTNGTFAILPASLLPLKNKWKAVSASLPTGSALIILPLNNPSLRTTLGNVAILLESGGHHVTVLETETFA